MNTPHNDNPASKLLEEALAIEAPPERLKYLEQACAGDQALFNDVRSLLSFAESWEGYVEQPPSLVNQSIGKYVIKAEIGRGGMGTVYLGVRTQDFKQNVAIKIINKGMLSQEGIRRFGKEMRIMARLNHPNLARLVDGGVTESGLPYVVMEYVEGQRIDEYCDNNKLTVEERLSLFCKVCSVVSYAHGKEIIHRDIKPSNILVTVEGEPKLIDFGIAKVLNSTLDTITYDPATLLSPSYSSPEQVRGDQTIGKTADVYSLGALLYELVTGHRAHRLKSNEIKEIITAVCEAGVTRPSQVILSEDQTVGSNGGKAPLTPEAVSEARGCNPKQLRRQLAGDLDAIILKALCKVPRQRYQSVKELADDIGNHFRRRPVVARKGSWWKNINRLTDKLASNLPPTGIGARPKLAAYLFLVGLGLVIWNSAWLKDFLETKPPLHQSSVRASLPPSKQLKLKNAVEKLADHIGRELTPGDLPRLIPWELSQMIVGSHGRAKFDEGPALNHLAILRSRECDCYDFIYDGHVAASGWVVLALLKLKIEPTARQVGFIVDNQEQTGGSWRLFAEASNSEMNASTYATAYSVLSLHEYLASGMNSYADKERLRKAIDLGQRWLLKNHIPDKASWWDTPHHPNLQMRKESVGLSGLVLHVLHRTGAAEKYPDEMRRLDQLWLQHYQEEINRLDQLWRQRQEKLPPAPQEVVHDFDESDVDLDGRVRENAKNVIMPWAVIATVDAYAAGNEQQKKAALRWMDKVISDVDGNIKDVFSKKTFIKAEWLIALRYVMGESVI